MMIKFLLTKAICILMLQVMLYGQCAITSINATPLTCNGFNFNVSVDLTVENPSSPGFTLAGNGMIYGTFLYSQLPVVVGPLLGDSESEYEIIAWDVENPDCQQFTTFFAIDCGPICSFSDVSLDLIWCANDDFAAVELDFDHENTTHPVFDLFYGDGTYIGSHLYESLPVLITSFHVNGADPIELKICDDMSSCCQTFLLDAIDCDPDDCEIYNVEVDPHCVSSNFFVVELDFDYVNVVSDSFSVTGNNINYGIFGYNELPITLGPLNGGANIQWEFVIRDTELASCVTEYELGSFNCPPPCNIFNLIADPLLCIEDDYSLLVEFEVEGEGNQGYAVFSNNKFYGNHSYEAGALNISPYDASGQFSDLVTVCDVDHPGCCETVEYEALLCAGCIIYNLEAVPQPCNDLGEIFVSIDFDFQNTGLSGFSVSGDGNQYGEFSYDDLPVLVGPFTGDGTQYLEFVVTDLEDDFCIAATEIGLLGCDDICEFSNLTVEAGACTGFNSYVAEIDFDFENVSGSEFDLYINGDYYESYDYTDLPVTIIEFPGSGQDLDTVRVCEGGNEDCCTLLVFEAPFCPCSIFDLSVENLVCDSDSTFSIQVEFFTENLPGDSVDISFDGNLMGTFHIADVPVIVEGIPEGDGTSLLTVCSQILEGCCEDIGVELMNCEAAQCLIYDLAATVGSCNSDSTYVIDITYSTSNLPQDSVSLHANDVFIGDFPASGNIHIINFPVFDAGLTSLSLCASGAPDCCDDFVFETPDCIPGDCEINNLAAVPGDCQTDSTYILLIEYDGENVPGDSVTISANGNFIGLFIDDDGHIVIDHFPVYDAIFTEITVCSFAFPDCCATFSFETPDCGGGNACNIFDLVAEPGDCQSDSTYLLDVNFQFSNLPSDSIQVTANGQIIGTFHINGGQFSIEDFPVLDAVNTAIEICATGAPDCCDSFEFLTPDCSGGNQCDIAELTTQIGDCTSDSTYNLTVNFLFSNLPVDSVVITSNEGYSQQFQLHEGQIVINDFPAFDDDVTEIQVCAVGAPDCCESFVFGTPDCTGGGTCQLFDLFVETGECTSDTTFTLALVFGHINLPGDSVIISVGNHVIGHFLIGEDFTSVPNFPLLPGENTTVTVCALEAPDCCDTYTFENPACGQGCDIFEVSVEIQDCSSDTTFNVIIDFGYENINTDGFDVYTTEGYLGFFTLEQIPIISSSFPANSSGEYVITICEAGSFDCCESFEFEGPVCGEGICDINNLEWSITSCDSAGQFYFILDFDFQHTGMQGFTVIGNGNNYGTFSYENLPIQIGPFESGTNTVFEFLVTDVELNTCFDFIEPGLVECIIDGVEEGQWQDIFDIRNNGTIPGILAREDLRLSLYNASGQKILDSKLMSSGDYLELSNYPNGFYLGTLQHGERVWPVKLIKAAY